MMGKLPASIPPFEDFVHERHGLAESLGEIYPIGERPACVGELPKANRGESML